MALKLYNTLTRKKEDFKEIDKGKVKLYSCGPTIYNFAHIGNFRAYVFADLLKRYLRYKGYAVTHVMNLTDVDDKTIRDSREEGVSLQEFTKRYEKAFFEDIDTLRIERADHYPSATGCINDMIGIIKRLKENGLTYEKGGSTYFRISAFKDYGKLAKIDVRNLKSGARVSQDEYDKENASDFALWKSYDEEDGDVYWETEFGKGRPGWHIECSAMSMKHLGSRIDIHTGGVDLVFPHHTNEIAQSEGATGERFVNYWLHNEHLIVNGKKMSKSLGNFYTLRDLLDKGFDPVAIRYVLLATHYRQQLNFTFESIEAAKNSIDRLNDLVIKLRSMDSDKTSQVSGMLEKAKEKFDSAMDDDLSVSTALAALFDLVRDVNTHIQDISRKEAEQVLGFLKKADSVLGIMTFDQEIPEDIQKMAADREEARLAKDFSKADQLRDEIKEKGYTVEDTPQGPRIKAIR